jgi:CubicO group peptidase (beta-lactamase class C family)
LCIALLVDKGYVKYEDKVTSFWPEFAQNGKEDTTVEHIMNHQVD